MKRILVADHSPHAQRMGERILRDEGFEVAAVTDGETALVRLKDLAPDLILADISLPSRDGYEICEYVKSSGKFPQTRVVLTAGPVAAYDEARAQQVGSDGFVRKPFEATALLGAVQPLLETPGETTRAPRSDGEPKAAAPAPAPAPVAPLQPKPVDREQVRAAVILALEASLINMIENVTDKVLVALESEGLAKAQPKPAAAQPAAPALKTLAAGAPGQATAPSGPPKTEPPKTQPGPAPDEPVVRIRTPIFRTLS
ncbi:MAG TPA: response regulator [Bryobacteraceae bacterium]|nr:response regulator [Bryobacteraceae bacterium]